jgi:hypothetical protein
MVRQRALESGQGNSYDARYMPWASFPSREDFNILRTYHASMTSLKLVDGLTHGVRFYYIPTVLHALNVVQSLAAASMSIHIMSGNVDNLYTRPYKYASVAKVVYVAYTSSCESAAIEAAYNIAFVYFAAGISAYYGLPIYVGFVFWSVAITSMNVVGFYLETRSPDFNKRSEEAYKNLNSYSSWFSDTQSTSWEDVGTTSTKIEIERPDTLESFTSDVQDDQFVRYGECDLAGETSSEEGCVAA